MESKNFKFYCWEDWAARRKEKKLSKKIRKLQIQLDDANKKLKKLSEAGGLNWRKATDQQKREIFKEAIEFKEKYDKCNNKI